MNTTSITTAPAEYTTILNEYGFRRDGTHTWASEDHTASILPINTTPDQDTPYEIVVANKHATACTFAALEDGKTAFSYAIHRCLKATQAAAPVCEAIRQEMNKRGLPYLISPVLPLNAGGTYSFTVFHDDGAQTPIMMVIKDAVNKTPLYYPDHGSDLGKELAAKLNA